MPKYIVRIELTNKKPNYGELATALKMRGFEAEIEGQGPMRYALPTGTYVLFHAGAHEEVLRAAKEAVQETRQVGTFLTIQSESEEWVGLPRVP